MTEPETIVGFDGSTDGSFLVVAHRQPGGSWRIAHEGLDTRIDMDTLIAALPAPAAPAVPAPGWAETVREWLDRFTDRPVTLTDWQQQVLAFQQQIRRRQQAPE